MKRLIYAFAALAILAGIFTSCSDYVKTDEFNNLEKRVATLEDLVNTASTNIGALQSAISVLEGKTSISGVEETADGYVIKFSDGKSVTITNEETPAIGIKKDSDGNYYWTLAGEWLLCDGQKVSAGSADGKTPQLRIENGKWQVSTDNGSTWTNVPTSGEYVIFKSVDTSDPAFVYITLQDGTVLKLTRGTSSVKSIAAIPGYSDGSIKITNEECALKFDVFPASAAEAVASLSRDKFSVKIVYTETKAAPGDNTTLDITDIGYSDGVLYVFVDGTSLDDTFFSKALSASALLSIEDGDTCVQSGYFSLYGVKKYSGEKWVDLGLPSHTLWATCNLGAPSPEQYGNHYAWAEIEPKADYDWSTYKYCLGLYNNITKYCTDEMFGTVDNRMILGFEDDAAFQSLGPDWRMPTYAEMSELKDACTWTWGKSGETYGYTVTGPNGASIFLPAAGCHYGTDCPNAGEAGYYWTNTLFPYDSETVWTLMFYPGEDVDIMDCYRDDGRSIRPVRNLGGSDR